ncbi:hypothetical protein ANN_17236 [Periplaneta americana]|uniref:Uncharacterized protein n=1 Tax=Periplaneta americana TaxID=6978 RepID=A0ABQ8STN5_PERAM|nr:hypothetical protein ANN_17236 [Periplaneta americana]
MPSTWPGVEPAIFGIEGQRYTNSPTRRCCNVVAEPSPYTVCVMQRSIIRVIGAFTILIIPDLESPSNPQQCRYAWSIARRHPTQYDYLVLTVAGNVRLGQAGPLSYAKGRSGDNAGEMSPGSSTESYPVFAPIGLRENPGKNLNQVTFPDRDSNPGHLVSRPDALTVTPQKAMIARIGKVAHPRNVDGFAERRCVRYDVVNAYL